jgi:hypothetical protein
MRTTVQLYLYSRFSLKEKSNTKSVLSSISLFCQTLHSFHFIHSLQVFILFSPFSSFSHHFWFSASFIIIHFLSRGGPPFPIKYGSQTGGTIFDLLSHLVGRQYLFTPLLKCAVECDERECEELSLLFFCLSFGCFFFFRFFPFCYFVPRAWSAIVWSRLLKFQMEK